MGSRGTHLLSLALVFLGIVELVLYARLVGWPSRTRTYTYKGDDHPNALDVDLNNRVALFMQNTVHYQMRGAQAQEEWDALSPGKGIVHLGPQKRPFMVSVFHQLRCLDVLRHGIVRADAHTFNVTTNDGEWETRHCLNYLRQMIMCRANTRLEKAIGLYLEHNTLNEQDYVCEDWRPLYAAVAQNELEYKGSH
ncbi:hypothetical protein AURDEDRAFT_108565 [Auricularia subglabra TFB-10046 SS5]|uniref:Uncharacterized protein n=1 Tax=Auricularia subglabra (strain TFB-10046 / SS5) TaxID=717982 RepID=J0CYV7_AURST|nr:hypothetical protein AURDEDRAFT_108565 [Auricularia subglabra TFB-10046 SS5]